VPFSREKNHLWKMPNTLLPASNARTSKKVMRYSGPRMILHHPALAMHHAIDGFKKPKKKAVKTSKAASG